MKNKIIIFILSFMLFIGISEVSASTYTSQDKSNCEFSNGESGSDVCTYSVVDSSGKASVAFCLDPTFAYIGEIGYELDTTKKAIDNSNGTYPIEYFECGLKRAYNEIPEMKNSDYYDANGVLKFNDLIGENVKNKYDDRFSKLINVIQKYVWENGDTSDDTSNSVVGLSTCSVKPYIDDDFSDNYGSIGIEIGKISYDKNKEVYTVDYIVKEANTKNGSIKVSTRDNIGKLSNTKGSGTLTLNKDDVQTVVRINVTAEGHTGVEHQLDTGFTILSPNVDERQTLGIPYLKRTLVDKYKEISDFVNIKNFNISKKDITNEEEVEGAKICVSEYDVDSEKKGENVFCFESGKEPYNFIINPGTYILEEEVAPKGYEKVETGFVFTVTDINKIELKDVKSNLIKYDDKHTITLYDVPIKEVPVESTGMNAKASYIILGLFFVAIGSFILYFKYFRNRNAS